MSSMFDKRDVALALLGQSWGFTFHTSVTTRRNMYSDSLT